MSPRARPDPLRVHLCLDQSLEDAGSSGLVRSWIRFLAEAERHPGLELTAHTLGRRRRERRPAPNVRIVEHPVRLGSTAALGRRGVEMPASVGLFPFHPRLARAVRGADVLHTPYAHFSFAMTALAVARWRRIPLVHSVHTHVPLHAEAYTRWFLERGRLARLGLDAVSWPARVRRFLEWQLGWYLARCDRVLVSSPEALGEELPPGCPADRVARLPRGIDRDLFHPCRRDPARLQRRFGLPPDEPVVLYVGRLMPEKSVLTLARALAALAGRGRRFRLLLCGEGGQREEIAAVLGERAVFAGVVPQEELGWIYASADVFALPSQTETFGNVIVEAMSSGLPVVVSSVAGAGQHVRRPGEEGWMLDRDDPGEWAAVLERLLGDAVERRRLGRGARARVEASCSTWAEIFDGIVVPTWREAAGLPARGPRAAPGPARDRSPERAAQVGVPLTPPASVGAAGAPERGEGDLAAREAGRGS